ncbi:MAG: hypothetical protein ABIJ34_00605 [archaeon]
MDIGTLLENLPSSEGYMRSMKMSEAEEKGIEFSGEYLFRLFEVYPGGYIFRMIEIHKMMTNDRLMHTYMRIGNWLLYQGSQELHE